MEASSSTGNSSPTARPVYLTDCIEEILRLTLSTFVDGTLGVDLPFSRDYCSGLLKDDPYPHLRAESELNPNVSCSSSIGVPQYPLYKQLASAIGKCINHGAFLKGTEHVVGITEDDLVNSKEKEWSELIADTRLKLLHMFEAVDFEFHVQEPFFSQLRDGLKTIEGRCAVGNYTRITSSAVLLLNKCFLLEVKHVERYCSFLEMLETEGLQNVLPGVMEIEKGVQIYRKFYSEEKEKANGVLAISVSRYTSQPSLPLAELLSGLNYEGVGCLLGMVHTVGTIPNALPPPRSALISSFTSPHHLKEVGGTFLTNGSRALAKHVNRSGDRWWGNFSGNDTNKNKLALGVLNSLFANCVWMNTLVQNREQFFEIRVADGYGARWSRDGSKFVGFLEPYLEQGHLKGWKH